RRGRTKDGSDEIVVEVRGSHGELRLLEREYSIVIPGTLPEGGKGNWMATNHSCVRLSGVVNVGHQLWTEQISVWLDGLEGAHPPQDFSAIVSSHPDRSDFSRALV